MHTNAALGLDLIYPQVCFSNLCLPCSNDYLILFAINENSRTMATGCYRCSPGWLSLVQVATMQQVTSKNGQHAMGARSREGILAVRSCTYQILEFLKLVPNKYWSLVSWDLAFGEYCSWVLSLYFLLYLEVWLPKQTGWWMLAVTPLKNGSQL